jgi:hypothetical protein
MTTDLTFFSPLSFDYQPCLRCHSTAVLMIGILIADWAIRGPIRRLADSITIRYFGHELKKHRLIQQFDAHAHVGRLNWQMIGSGLSRSAMWTASKDPLRLPRRVALGLAILFVTGSVQRAASEGQTANQIDFPPAQEAYCTQLPPDSRVPREECAKAKGILALMSVERRDDPWADDVESTLEKWSASLDSSEFTFRDVECRLSLCFIELGSTVGAGRGEGWSHNLIVDPDIQRKNKIFHFMATFAPDLDDPNAHDVLMFFKRYCTSIKDLLDSHGHMQPGFYTKNCSS